MISQCDFFYINEPLLDDGLLVPVSTLNVLLSSPESLGTCLLPCIGSPWAFSMILRSSFCIRPIAVVSMGILLADSLLISALYRLFASISSLWKIPREDNWLPFTKVVKQKLSLGTDSLFLFEGNSLHLHFWEVIFIEKTTMFTVLCRHALSEWQST